MEAEDSKYKIYKQSIRIQVELLGKNKQLIISIFDKNNEHSLLFQNQFQFSSFKNDSDLFLSNWHVFTQMVKYTFQQKQSNIVFTAEGQLTISYEQHGLGQTFIKSTSFKLKRRLEYQDEVRILREKVNTYQFHLSELKKEFTILKIQNAQILGRLSILEQMVQKKPSNNYAQRMRENQLAPHPLGERLVQPAQIPVQDQVPEVVQNLTFDADTEALYYSKFKIEDSKITSLHEDYYQVHCRNPLPKNGVTNISFKMCGKNHYSIGIISESELKNQYSFQNKNSICLYTYFDGSFRGIYVRGEYMVLDEWSIEPNEIVEMKINLTTGKLSISMRGRAQAKEINIRGLQQRGDIYFFLQMYQKDNVLQFIRE